jgi:hypothetical protein
VSRPRGFAQWNPKPDTLAVLADVEGVLARYSEFLPLTARQIFYALVGTTGYDKTEKAYARLCEYLVRARRAQMIPFESIRDDGTTHHDFVKYLGVSNFWEQMVDHADHYVRDKMADQPVYVELWCEAAGMVPQLERVANRYSIPVYSTGGFSSVTVTYEIAERALARDRPTVFLHAGDYDPSGESIFDSMTRDSVAFLRNRMVWEGKKKGWPSGVMDEIQTGNGGLFVGAIGEAMPEGYPDLRPRRVALTEEQVEEHDLPTAPAKPTDTRSANWVGETCQLEAMPPDLLAEVIQEAILSVLDRDRLEEVWLEEKRERQVAKEQIARLIESGDTEDA